MNRLRMKRWIYEASKSFIPIAKKFYEDRFDREGWQPNRFVRWEELANSTKVARKSKGFPYPTYPMLVNTGKLKESIRYVATTDGLNIFSNLEYAKYNNTKRPFIYKSGLLTIQYNRHLANYIADKLNSMKW